MFIKPVYCGTCVFYEEEYKKITDYMWGDGRCIILSSNVLDFRLYETDYFESCPWYGSKVLFRDLK